MENACDICIITEGNIWLIIFSTNQMCYICLSRPSSVSWAPYPLASCGVCPVRDIYERSQGKRRETWGERLWAGTNPWASLFLVRPLMLPYPC